ncbi:MAG: hypothetical protein ABEJ55_04580 [Halanaeroarchaeum sp.]
MSSPTDPDELQDVKFVGPATAAVLADAEISAKDVVERRVSHAALVEAGVNPGVAAKIRREHSLAWSMAGGEDLDRRAKQVRGLKDDERAWVAASSGSWEGNADQADGASADGSGSATEEESAWRDRSWPTPSDAEAVDTDELAWREASNPEPVRSVEGIDDDAVTLLAGAGITSVRRLATVHPGEVADSLGVPEDRVREWRDAAREYDR